MTLNLKCKPCWDKTDAKCCSKANAAIRRVTFLEDRPDDCTPHAIGKEYELYRKLSPEQNPSPEPTSSSSELSESPEPNSTSSSSTSSVAVGCLDYLRPIRFLHYLGLSFDTSEEQEKKNN